MWQQAGLKERKDEVNYAWKHGVEPPEQLTSGAFVRDNSSLISVTSGFMDCNGWWAGQSLLMMNGLDWWSPVINKPVSHIIIIRIVMIM
jgi:hypothetical protein